MVLVRRPGDIWLNELSKVLARIHCPARPSTIVPDIRALFGLTRSEMKVLHCLIDGMKADALAGCLNITIETARTHIRRVYNKMDVSSREQLIALTNRYRVP